MAAEPQRIGRFVLTRRLGRGGMGEVWQADMLGPRGFRKTVAVKLLRRGPVVDGRIDALVREAKLGARLHHPHVVGVHGLEHVEGRWVVVMELVRGRTVGALLARGPLPPLAVLDIGQQAARGLEHIHAMRADQHGAQLVHRDIKPTNLLVDELGTVKVADLGIAAPAGGGEAVGTPGFLAPEQLRGHAVAASDWFALGVTLYACATGRRLFGGGRRAIQRLAAWDEAGGPELDIAAADHACPGLGRVLARCLAHDPGARWSGAPDLIRALAAVRGSMPVGPDLREIMGGTAIVAPAPGPDAAPSAASTTRVVRGNLPRATDGFVGRARHAAMLSARLAEGAGLTTVAGVGGLGKTRLALEAARAQQPDLPGGAWFVDLASARDEADVCAVMGRVLGVQLGEANDPSRIGYAARHRGRALFLLDNVESCHRAVADVLPRWLDQAHEAHWLCTSQVVLGLAEETVVRLEPLTTDEACELFRFRAAHEIPRAHDAALRALLAQVDGLPLAIELLAARTRILPVPELAERFGLRMIGGGGRALPERHRSMEASLDASWHLLSDAGQRAMPQLAVFCGSFDLSAAEAVLAPDTEDWALDLLTELVDASLVQVDTGGRFSLLSLVRRYAAERAAAGVRDRHARWFAQRAHTSDARELEDRIAAMRYALDCGYADLAVDNAMGVWTILEPIGPFDLARQLLLRVNEALATAAPFRLTLAYARALAQVGEHGQAVDQVRDALERDAGSVGDLARASALRDVGRWLHVLGLVDKGISSARDSVAAFRAVGERTELGTSLSELGFLFVQMGRADDAREAFDEAMPLLRDPREAGRRARALSNRSALQILVGDEAGARASLEEARGLHEALGDSLARAHLQVGLGHLHHQQGRVRESVACMWSALDSFRAAGSRRDEGLVLGNLGAAAAHRQDIDAALPLLHRAAAIHREVGSRRLEATALNHIAHVLGHDVARSDEALAVLDEALPIHREAGNQTGELVALLSRAQILTDAGRAADALPDLDEAQALAEKGGVGQLQALVLSVRASAMLAVGRVGEARAMGRDALAGFEGSGATNRWVVEALCLQGRIGLRAGDRPAALARLHQAEALADRMELRAGSPTRAEIQQLRRALSAAHG